MEKPCRNTTRHGSLSPFEARLLTNSPQHSVIPSGKLRFALTCRYVRPELVDPAQHWKGDYTAPPGSVYDGDEAAATQPSPASTGATLDDWTMVEASPDAAT